MGVTSFSGSTSSVSFSFKPTATNSNITALKFNSNNQPKFEHTFVAHDNVDKGWVAENFDKFNNFLASASATVVVGVGAVRFGVAKFGERFVDAGVNVVGWAKSGVYQLFGNDEAAARAEKRATDFISRDLTGEAKEDFYENTILGRAINEKSYVKYDSEIANKIQNVSEKATEIGTEVAASFIPGAGLAVSATIGAVSGMGKSAEKNYQSGNSMKDAVLDIGIDTVTGALEGYSAGAMGNAAISGIKTLNSLGVNGAKALAKEKFSNFSGRVALDTLKQNSGKIIRQSAANTLKDPDFYVDALGSSSEDIASALRGESSWYDTAKAITINYGISFVSNFAFNYAGGVGSSVFDSANYGHRIDGARDEAFKAFQDRNPQLSSSQLIDKKIQIDAAAERLYDKNAMNDYSQFYEVLGMEKGSRPDPSNYLKPEYIDSQMAIARENGVSRITSEADYEKFVVKSQIGGNPTEYIEGSSGVYTKGSEFMSPSSNVDDTISQAMNSNNPSRYLEDAYALNKGKLRSGARRYDVAASELDDLNIRIPSGNEPGAFDDYWVPGGMTLGGESEFVIDRFAFNQSTIKHYKLNLI